MKIKLINIVLILFLMLLPGCFVLESRLTECQKLTSEQQIQVDEKEQQKNDLETQVKDSEAEKVLLEDILEAKNVQINEKTAELKKLESESAKIQISISPDPIILLEDGVIKWKVIIKEKNGIGVKVKSWACIYYYNFSCSRRVYDLKLENSYLPALGEHEWGMGFDDKGSIKYLAYILEGEDDNGNPKKAISDKIPVKR